MDPELSTDNQTDQSSEPAVALQQETSPVATSKKKTSKKKLLLIILTAAVLLIAGMLYFLVFKKDDVQQAVTQYNSTDTIQEPEPEPGELDRQLASFISPASGEEWYEEAKKLPLQGFVKDETPDVTAYYEIGKRSGNAIILRTVDELGTYGLLYEKAPDGKVSAIVRPNANINPPGDSEEYITTTKPDTVSVDTSIHYDSLSIPSRLELTDGEYLTLDYMNLGGLRPGDQSSSGLTYKEIKKYGKSTLYKTERQYTDTGLTSIGYEMRLPPTFHISMVYKPIGDDGSKIVWTNGNQVSGDIGGIVRGCGSTGSVSRGDIVTDTDFVVAGTVNGMDVYTFKDNDHILIKKSYDEFVDFYDNEYASAEERARAAVSKKDFVDKQHAIFAYKSKVNDWLIYTRGDYAPQGGCAKPVVYLYPNAPTAVTVKVGADVKISEPLYNPEKGWKVLAWPSGHLTVSGKIYDSLFWEGPGWGEYPAITSGTVVKREEATVTMRRQLVDQGLLKNEIDDFMEYWQDSIPNKPYVRLTWFSTQELDILAPLRITPKPDVIIRVFLDMAGYDHPIKLPPQQLKAVPRGIFTAVEWGGLSHTKLY